MKPADYDPLILDGACGTTIQDMDFPPEAWDRYEGCNEYLNLSAPEAVVGLHRAFYAAGAHVAETNTFGASRIVLAEYGLEDRTREINTAAVRHAREAAAGVPGRFVAGSVGPSTKLPSLGHIAPDAMLEAYREQMGALVEAGVDLLLLETCQDLLQVKLALVSAYEVQARAGREVPVMLSVTVERTGTMLVGSDIAAVVATVEPFPLFSLGLNCATGPVDMIANIQYLKMYWPGRISCYPNQGLPEVVDGKTVYPMQPDEFAAHLRKFVADYGVSVVGGCCGTTPEHIRCLVEALRGVKPAVRSVIA